MCIFTDLSKFLPFFLVLLSFFSLSFFVLRKELFRTFSLNPIKRKTKIKTHKFAKLLSRFFKHDITIAPRIHRLVPTWVLFRWCLERHE